MNRLQRHANDWLASINKQKLDNALLKYIVNYLCDENVLYQHIDCEWTVEENIESLDEYTDDIFYTLENGIDNIAKNIINDFNIDIPIDKLSQEIIDYVKHNDALINDIKEKVDKYIENVFKKIEDVQYFITPDNNIPVNEICELDDAVGTVTTADESIDVDTREAAFAYVDGTIISGEYKMTHTQLLNEYLSNNGNNEFEEKYYRLSEEEIQKESDFNKVAFGHILAGNVYVIDEESLLNVSLNEVVQAIEERCTYKKIYQASNRICLKRLAKVIK